MKYYEYEGKIYKSHSKKVLCRRLFSEKLRYGESRVHNFRQKAKLLKKVKKEIIDAI